MTTAIEREQRLDAAILEALADGAPHTRDDLEKVTQAPTAHVASSVRRLDLQGKVRQTSAKGKRVYVMLGAPRAKAPEPEAAPEAQTAEA